MNITPRLTMATLQPPAIAKKMLLRRVAENPINFHLEKIQFMKIQFS